MALKLFSGAHKAPKAEDFFHSLKDPSDSESVVGSKKGEVGANLCGFFFWQVLREKNDFIPQDRCTILCIHHRRGSRICGRGGGHRERRRREALLGGSGEHGEASSLIRGKGPRLHHTPSRVVLYTLYCS